MTRKFHTVGFTLAELLIALAILGVIATFTIPKVLQAQQNQKLNAAAKEALATVSGAYSVWLTSNTPQATDSPRTMLPSYLNYVSVATSTTVVQDMNGNTTCGSIGICLVLHNGGYLGLDNWTFGDTPVTKLNAVPFFFDPDGPGVEKGVWMALYSDGRITTWPNILAGTRTQGSAATPTDNAAEPSWFKWN